MNFRCWPCIKLPSSLGVLHIHTSLGPHTRLSSKCCFVDGRFVLKITDYGLPTMFSPTLSEYWMAKRDPSYAEGLLWTAPEKLRASAGGAISKDLDSYSFAIILQEIALRSKPFSMFKMTPSGKKVPFRVYNKKRLSRNSSVQKSWMKCVREFL